MDSRHDACADRWTKVGGEQKGVAGREAEIPHLDQIAVGELHKGEVVAPHEFDERDITGRIEPHEHCVIESAVREPALHRDARRLHHVKIRQRIAIRTDQHSRAAPCFTRKDGDGRLRSLFDRDDALLLSLMHRRRHVVRGRGGLPGTREKKHRHDDERLRSCGWAECRE